MTSDEIFENTWVIKCADGRSRRFTLPRDRGKRSNRRNTMAKIKRFYTRLYRDTGQKTLYVEWLDGGRTECDSEKSVSSTHMRALVAAAQRQGLVLEQEVW